MRLGVVGGRLQGTEVAYLALEAGYEVVLVDRVPHVPASGLAHEVHVLDVAADQAAARAVLETCDAVLPACENAATLRWLSENLPAWQLPLAFHMPSYEVSCSKVRSDELFGELDVPRPLSWPGASFPVVVKPSGSSGSEGVRVAADDIELEFARAALEADGHEVVIQEYVDGTSLSLEVVSDGHTIRALLPTLLEFDEFYDCKRVVAPADSPASLLQSLRSSSERIAHGLGLWGLMDVEAMAAGTMAKVIEIDARIPSQTPTCVYHSGGVNMVELLARLALEGRLPDSRRETAGACVYEHVRAAEGRLQILGEHVMSHARPLRRWTGFFGAHCAVTDFAPGVSDWVATLVHTGAGLEEARFASTEVVARLARDLGLEVLPESAPRLGVGQ